MKLFVFLAILGATSALPHAQIGIKDDIRDAMGKLDEILGKASDKLDDFLGDAKKSIVDMIKQKLADLVKDTVGITYPRCSGGSCMADEEAIQFGVVDDLLKNLLDQVKGSMKEKLMEILKNLLKEKLGGLITYTGTKEDDLVVYGILDDILESLGPIKDQLIKDAVDNIKKNVVDKIGEIDAKAAIKKAIDAFVDSIQRGGGKRLGYGLLDDLLEDLKGALESKAKEAAKAILDLIKEQLPGTYGMVDEEAIQFGVVDDLLKNLLDQVKGSMKEKLMEILKNLLKEKLGGLISFGSTEEVYGILDDILESLGPIKDQLIKDAVDNIKKNVVDKIGEIDAKAAIKKAIDAFVDSIQRGGGKRLGYGLHDDLLDALKEALAGKAKETVKAILDLIKEQLPGTYGIRDLLDSIKSDFIDKVKENLQKNVIDKLKELDTAKIAEKAIEKVMDKIKEKITYQQSFVDAGSIADAILDWVERAAGGAPPQEIQDKVKKSLEALIEAIPGLGYAGTNTTYLDLKDIVGKVLEILAHLAEKA